MRLPYHGKTAPMDKFDFDNHDPMIKFDFDYHYGTLGVAPTAGMEDIQNVDPDLHKDESWEVLRDIRSRLQWDCDVGVSIDLIEKHISEGTQLVATAAATINEMEKGVADADKALVELESRWLYPAGVDEAIVKNNAIFQDRVDDARVRRTELEAECAIKSKRLVRYQQHIQYQLSVMEDSLAYFKTEKRNLMVPLSGMFDERGELCHEDENDEVYYRALPKAWEDAEKRARDEGLDRHTWPVHEPLNAAEYGKERMLYLSNTIRQTRSAKMGLAKEIEKRDAQIREKDILLAEKDDQLRGKDEQIRDRDAQIRAKDAEIQQKDAQIRQLDARHRRSHPRDTDEASNCQLQ